MNKRQLLVRVLAAAMLTCPFLLSAAEWAGGARIRRREEAESRGNAVEPDRDHARRRLRLERQSGQRLGLGVQCGERREHESRRDQGRQGTVVRRDHA